VEGQERGIEEERTWWRKGEEERDRANKGGEGGWGDVGRGVKEG